MQEIKQDYREQREIITPSQIVVNRNRSENEHGIL